MIKKFLTFLIVLLIAIAGFLLMTADEKPTDQANEEHHIKLADKEETDPLIFEARKAVIKAHQLFLVSSEEELADVLQESWSEPEFAQEVYADMIHWILSREIPFSKVETNFANETITSTESGDFITYTATVTILLYKQKERMFEKTFTGIYNIVKEEDDIYRIQNLQLLEPAENEHIS